MNITFEELLDVYMMDTFGKIRQYEKEVYFNQSDISEKIFLPNEQDVFYYGNLRGMMEGSYAIPTKGNLTIQDYDNGIVSSYLANSVISLDGLFIEWMKSDDLFSEQGGYATFLQFTGYKIKML